MRTRLHQLRKTKGDLVFGLEFWLCLNLVITTIPIVRAKLCKVMILFDQEYNIILYLTSID